MICFFINIKTSYYWFIAKSKMQISKLWKEKAAKCYTENKDVLKKNATNMYKSLSEEEREAKRKFRRNKYKNLKGYAMEDINFCTL